MRLSDVEQMINGGGIHCNRWKIPDCDLPYAVVTKPSNGNQKYADNDMWYGSMKIVLFLAIYYDDEETEYKMDDILDKNNINYTYKMEYLDEDNICVKIYTFELKED